MPNTSKHHETVETTGTTDALSGPDAAVGVAETATNPTDVAPMTHPPVPGRDRRRTTNRGGAAAARSARSADGPPIHRTTSPDTGTRDTIGEVLPPAAEHAPKPAAWRRPAAASVTVDGAADTPTDAPGSARTEVALDVTDEGGVGHSAGGPGGTDAGVAEGVVSGSTADRVWGALRADPGATPAELATGARLSRSTVTKLLTAWAAEGSATSEPGTSARAARRWTAAPSVTSTIPTADGPTRGGGTPADDAPARAAGDGAEPSTTTETNAAAATTVGAERRKASMNRSGSTRLGSGALRGMVEEFLTEHPGEHGPVAIGKALGRSSGAVANALESMVETGRAVRTGDKPKRYQCADSDVARVRDNAVSDRSHRPLPPDGASDASVERADGDGAA